MTNETATPTLAPAHPTFDDQVAAVDAIAVTAAIVAGRKRVALLTSTVEIVALAQLANALLRAVDMTFEMLGAADKAHAEQEPLRRRALVDLLRGKIDDVAAELEALGYGVNKTALTATETTNGEEEAQRG